MKSRAIRLRHLAIALLLLLGPMASWGQLDQPMLRFAFDRQNDFTFSTDFGVWLPYQKGKYELDLRLLHSNIYNTARTEDRLVQFYVHSDVWQHFNLSKRWAVASWLETDQYVNNQNEKITFYLGTRYRPWDFLELTPLIGYTWDTRTAFLGQTTPTVRLDQGLSPALLLKSSHDFPDKLSMRSLLIARYKDIQPRRQHNLVVQHEWTKEFEEGVTLVAGLNAGSHELDDYQANSVKRILSDSIMPYFHLGYKFLPGLEWRSQNSLMLHRRRFLFKNFLTENPEENNLTFQGMEASTLQSLQWIKGRWRNEISYEFAYSSRGYTLENNLDMNANDFENRQESERQKDFVKNFHKLSLVSQLPLGKRHIWETRLFNQYLQYDTPSEANFDDRDELSWVGSGKWKSRWRKDFQTGLELQGNYRHYAFLLKEKSQDNYIQRSLRMDFDFGWDIGKQIRVEGIQSIYVTYNVKDFTDYNRTDRSTRNLESNFKGTWQPSRRWQVDAGFRRKETHQSYLNWAAFTETTLDTNRILTAELKARYKLEGKKGRSQWFLDGGYKHFDQTRQLKANMVGLDNLLKAISLHQVNLQTGPLVAIGYRNKNQNSIDLSLWSQMQVQYNRFEVLATDQIFGGALQEGDLLKVKTEFRPYLSARIHCYLGQQKTATP